jgi:glycosyltransferase involved in cell wall biosynthesis
MTRPAAAPPSVSVLLSCYNGARWLEEALESVLQQTFCDFEFIIVDDGSTDRSVQIIESCARRDPRVVVIRKENTGLADSLNVGIRRARGQWIARIDADDIAEPTRLAHQVAKAASDVALVFVGAGFHLIDEQGNRTRTYSYADDHRTLLEGLRSAGRFPPHSSAFYKADAVRSLGGYRPRVRRAEDLDLWLRLSEIGRLGVAAEPLVRIRKHAEQISNEAAGRSQVVDARVAIVSYWLRKHAQPDPVAADEDRFALFRAWVQTRLEQEGLFALNDYLARLKSGLVGSPRPVGRAAGLAARALREPALLMRMTRTRLFGESLARRLASEWSQRTHAHVS